MDSKKSDDLIDKYLNANSSLEEEQELFNSEDLGEGLDQWSTYVNQHRLNPPSDLNASILASIQSRKRMKRGFLIRLSGIAAALVLLILVFNIGVEEDEMGYKEKETILTEALAMFPEEESNLADKSIIYEDDIIIVFIEGK